VRDGGDRRLAVVVSLDLGNESVVDDVRVEEVDAAAFARIGPLDVELDGDALLADDGFGDLCVNAFPEEAIESTDDVGTASALVGMIVVTPASVGGEEESEFVEVVVCER
jgi:hypothetical protein